MTLGQTGAELQVCVAWIALLITHLYELRLRMWHVSQRSVPVSNNQSQECCQTWSPRKTISGREFGQAGGSEYQ
jgi:hypothetical protein